MNYLSFKNVSDGQSNLYITIKYVFIFLQIIIRSKKKIDVRDHKTFKLKFILMLFDSVYTIRPSDTVTKYTIYPLSYWWKDYSNGIGSYFATLSYG